MFPSATHTRFEHSLGVAHKAHELAHQIFNGQGAQLGITREDVHTVELAGEQSAPFCACRCEPEALRGLNRLIFGSLLLFWGPLACQLSCGIPLYLVLDRQPTGLWF